MGELLYYGCLTFFVYGFFGWCAEVAFAACKQRKFVNRGFLNGPICPIYGVGVTMVVFCLNPLKDNLLMLYLVSIVLVTVLEGVTGFAMDKIFHNKWWDYSEMPFNIGGYVCLLFSLIWGVACVLIVDLLNPPIFRALEWLPKAAGITLIVVLGGALLADLYVTTAGIIKMNKQLESMKKIAAELREISDQLGENIYGGVIAVLEKSEESRQKLEESKVKLEEKKDDLTSEVAEVTEEMKERISTLKTKYKSLEKGSGFVGRRLIKAFPKMKSDRYKEQMEKMRIRLVDKKRKDKEKKLNSEEE